MKVLIKYLIVQFLLLLALGLSAHNPDLSSTLLVEESEGKWILQIRAALTAFEYEIENHYGEASYATPEEFQKLVLNHVSENLSILSNGEKQVILQNGYVKLGHETSVTFEVDKMPSILESLYVRNSSFKNIPRNQSALIILKKGFAKNQFKLDNKNEHTIGLRANNSKFELIIPSKEASGFSLFFLLGVVLIFTILLIGYKLMSNRKANLLHS